MAVRMGIKLRALVGASVVAFGFVAAPAQAEVVLYDNGVSFNGLGWVGKGDVQTALGWNNAQLQSNASGVAFTYKYVANYVYVCEWITGSETKRKVHNVTKVTTTDVSSAVNSDPRLNPKQQITGFELKGFGAETATGKVPALGDECLGEGTDGKIIAVDLDNEETPLGGLYVNFGTQSVLIKAVE